MIGSKYLLMLAVVVTLGAPGFYPKPASAEEAAPGDRSLIENQETPSSAAEEDEAKPPSPRSPLRVDSFDYEDAGDMPGKLKLAGIALPGNELFLYFDNQPFATVVPDDAGNWSAEGELKLDDGQHSLRAEQFDPETRMLAARAIISIQRAKQPPDGAAKAP